MNRIRSRIAAVLLWCITVSAQQTHVNPKGPASPNRSSQDKTCDEVQSCLNAAVAAYDNASNSEAERKAQLANAQAYATKCIQLGAGGDHRAAECYHIRGRVFYINRDYPSSIIDELQAAQIDDSRAEYHWILGKAYYQMQNFGRAQSEMEKCLAHNPIDRSAAVECFLVLGKSFYAQNHQCGKAIGPLEQALKEAKLRSVPMGDRAEILLALGKAYQCVGNDAKAIEEYRAVLDLGGNGEVTAEAKRELENLGKL